jgi:hypothetical protein
MVVVVVVVVVIPQVLLNRGSAIVQVHTVDKTYVRSATLDVYQKKTRAFPFTWCRRITYRDENKISMLNRKIVKEKWNVCSKPASLVTNSTAQEDNFL